MSDEHKHDHNCAICELKANALDWKSPLPPLPPLAIPSLPTFNFDPPPLPFMPDEQEAPESKPVAEKP